MMNVRLWCGRIALIVMTGLTPLCADANSEQEVSENIAEILSSLRELTGVPAYSVAIVRDGQLLARSAVGEIDVRNHINAQPENWFRLASVSKVIGATMLALLVQQGKLDPNGPIGAYLPGLPSEFRGLTALQLLAHTSGLPHYQARDVLIAETHYETAIEALESVGNRELISTPGDSYTYSSHGYTILSALYEAITGESLREAAPVFIKEFSGRESPALENLRQRNSRRSNVFDVTADGAQTLKPIDQSYSPFATGFTASASDLAYFGDAVLHSPKIDEETRELLFRPVELSNGGKTGNYLYEVAFGWRVGKDPSGRTVYHHAGVTQGARSVLILYPEFGLSIAFLSNASWKAQIERTAFALASIVIEDQSLVTLRGRRAFNGFFDGRGIAGTLSCEGSTGACRFSDDFGVFSEWLMQYLPNKDVKTNWPLFVVQGRDGFALKIVTSVGVVELHRTSAKLDSDRFQAEIGNGRVLDIVFSEMFPPR